MYRRKQTLAPSREALNDLTGYNYGHKTAAKEEATCGLFNYAFGSQFTQHRIDDDMNDNLEKILKEAVVA
jgi:hypothetical protein